MDDIKRSGAEKHSKKHIPDIVQAGHPALHSPSLTVPVSEISSPKIRKVLENMTLAIDSQEDGVGLAAPQIGESVRIFMVAGFIFDRIKTREKKLRVKETAKSASEGMDENENANIPETSIPYKEETEQEVHTKSPHQFFINPEIIRESKEKKWMDGEGCLSVRWLYGKVRRSTRVVLRAHNEKGEIIERGASGILAHIFQHEVDHLNGILFIDKAKDIQEFDPEEIRAEAKLAKARRDKNSKGSE